MRFLRFLVLNFGPLAAFVVVSNTWALKPAIAASTLFTLLLVLRLYWKNEKPTLLFIGCSAVSLLFGGADLFLETPFLLKYEPTVVNFGAGVLCFISLFREKTLIQEIAEGQRDLSRVDSRELRGIFLGWTVAWGLFYLARAGGLAWLAYHADYAQWMWLKVLLGQATFWTFLGITWILSRRTIRARLAPDSPARAAHGSGGALSATAGPSIPLL